MKKMMLAVAAVAAVCTVNAAQFYWGGESQIIAGYEGGSGEGASGSGYLLWSDATGGLTYSAAEAVLADWANGKVADLSGITGKAFSPDEGFDNPAILDGGSFESQTVGGLDATAGKYYALFVTEDAKGNTWAYLSSEQTVDAIDQYGATMIVFENEAERSAAGTGWSTQAAPEPTSGMLLLLGVAGLALRRRRA